MRKECARRQKRAFTSTLSHDTTRVKIKASKQARTDSRKYTSIKEERQKATHTDTHAHIHTHTRTSRHNNG